MHQTLVFIILASVAIIYSQRCDSITCGVDIGVTYTPNITTCSCTSSDYSAHFTPCQQDTKNLFYFWKPPAVCLGTSLPSPAYNIPCALSCQDGEFFNSTTSTCDHCPGGTFSSTSLSYTQWTSIPGQFKASCENPYNPCQKWQPKGTYIDSGKNYDWGKSELTMEVEMYSDGNMTFTYQVDCEDYWDFFGFYLNGDEKLRVSSQLTWKSFSVDLKRGHHTFKWLYSKDSIMSKGEDKAKIQKIVINGAIDVLTSCTACPKGTFSVDGATSGTCSKCAAGTFNPMEGQTGCLTCPPMQTSFEGASKCIPLSPPCRSADYYSYKMPCEGSVQTLKYDWIRPVLCNTTHPDSIVLPSPTSVECDSKCHAGQQFIAGSCQYCPDKTFSNGATVCSTCDAGKLLSPRVSIFANFSVIPKDWETGCDGDCVSNWRALGSHMDSGFGNGISTTWIDYPVIVDSALGETIIKYQQSCLADAGVVSFWIDGQIVQKFTCSGCSNDKKTLVLPLSNGAHRVMISYESNSLSSQEMQCSRVLIDQISVVGGSQGGSVSCKSCPSGTISQAGSFECQACDAGQFSKSGDITCSICPKDTFSYHQSPACWICGNGMSSSEGSSQCFWKFNGTSCYFEQVVNARNKKFNWQELSSLVSGRTFKSDTGDEFGLNLDGFIEHSCPPGSFVCKINKDGSILDLGNSASMSIVDQHLHIDFTNYNPRDLNGTQPIKVSMDLYCDAEDRGFNPENDVAIYGSGNNYIVEVFSNHGCPLCIEGDWEENIGQCEDGKRKHIWIKKPDDNDPPFVCAKGVSKEITYTDCSNTAAFPIWVVFVILIPFLLLLTIVVVIGAVVYYRHRKLQSQFQLLVEDQDMGHEKL